MVKALVLTALCAASFAFAADAPAPAVATTNASPARTKDNVEFVIGPVYANAPELAVKEGVPRGAIHEFTMNSEDSKIYPGIAQRQPGTVPYKRKVAVYVPKQYVAGTAQHQNGMRQRQALSDAVARWVELEERSAS